MPNLKFTDNDSDLEHNLLNVQSPYVSIESLNKYVGQERNISICPVNIVSLTKNIDNLEEFLNMRQEQFDVICISETRLHSENEHNVNIPGYRMININSKTRAGGVAILLSDSLIFSKNELYYLDVDGCEDVWVDIELPCRKTLLVGLVYRHPWNDLHKFTDAFTNRLNSFKSKQMFTILGDFNIDANKSSCNGLIKNYFDQVYSTGCIQLISNPTRVTDKSRTIIDHIYTNYIHADLMTPRVITHDISDHWPTFVQIQTTLAKRKTHNRPIVRKITQNLIDQFLSHLECTLASENFQQSTSIEELIRVMSTITNLYFPKKKSRGNNTALPTNLGFPKIF